MKAKNVLKNLLFVTIACVIVSAIYLAYFFFIGVPKTQARTYYNQAITKLDDGDREGAKEDLQKALTFWNEAYIQEELNNL